MGSSIELFKPDETKESLLSRVGAVVIDSYDFEQGTGDDVVSGNCLVVDIPLYYGWGFINMRVQLGSITFKGGANRVFELDFPFDNSAGVFNLSQKSLDSYQDFRANLYSASEVSLSHSGGSFKDFYFISVGSSAYV